MKLTFLWTDQCFLLVLVLSLLSIIYGLRKKHTRQAFCALFKKPIAASSAIILLLFLLIGVLDSIHYQYMNHAKSQSLLDRMLAPLNTHHEKTYSAPFALRLYTKEIKMVDGKALQVHPRLNYPPQRFKNAKDVKRWTVKTVTASIGLSFLATLLVGLGLCVYKKTKYGTFLSKPTSAQISAFLTLFIVLTVVLAGYFLSRHIHVLGTGKIGQDIFYYAIKSIRTGLVIGTLTTLFMMPLALILGMSAGYFGGFVDDLIQYIYTTLSSIPGVLLITASILAMQTYISNHPQQFTTLAQSADARLLALCFILGVTSWTSLCRLLRAETLKLKEIDFVLAAQALGTGSFHILKKHILPNVMHIVLITLVLDFSFLVLAEAVLSYVGVGVSPLTISWGNMINASRLELAREPIVWWPMFAAFLFMFVLVLASNLFADAVRDVFDPRQAKLI